MAVTHVWSEYHPNPGMGHRSRPGTTQMGELTTITWTPAATLCNAAARADSTKDVAHPPFEGTRGMQQGFRLLCVMTASAIVTTLGVAAGPAEAAGTAQTSIVSASSWGRTPQVLDTAALTSERVLTMAEVGNRIVVGGYFAQVRNVAANGSATYNRSYVFAFDPATGAVDPNFAPVLNGVVNKVLAGPNDTVYVGGAFTQLNGATTNNLVQLSLATGQKTAFKVPSINGSVNDLALSGSRLFIGGQFTTVGGVAHGGLATVNATTGALDPYMGVNVAQHHNYPDRGSAMSAVGVQKLDITPDGTRLVAIGNFRQAGGLVRDQVVMVLLQATSATVDPNWQTTRYSPACQSSSIDSYVRDVQFSPDGSYFSIVATGGPGFGGSLCDAATRWQTSAQGQAVQPTWVAYTGGDTIFSVAITGSAIYIGGHMRWMNNSLGSDSARAGAVPRPGIAALDPRTGIPLTWNPGRNPRGIGAQALLATSQGLYVGSDTEYIGNNQYLRPRLAYFPLAGGAALPDENTGSLPGNVYLAGRATATPTADVNDVVGRYYDGVTAAPDALKSNGGTNWSQARGAFMAGNTLFYGYPNPKAGNSYYLYRRTFDGTTFGTATPIDPYNDPYWSTVSAGSRKGVTTYYRGVVPSMYGAALGSVTGMFFSAGRLYYTRSGSSSLYYRGFSVDSGVVGADEFVAVSSGWSDVAGMFLSGGNLYWASSATGQLRRMPFVNGVPGGATTTVDATHNWRSRALFLGPGKGPNTPPAATFSPSCTGLSCAFDGTGSSDPDGTIASWAWTFGDGTTTTGSWPSKKFTAPGTYNVSLTVTDDSGATATSTRAVTAAPTAPGTGIGYRDAIGTSGKGVTSLSLTVPATVNAGDGMVLVASTNSGATATPPTGYTAEGTQTSGTNITTQVFSRVATSSDAGSTLTVGFSASAKVTLQLAVYSGTSLGDPVSSVTGAVDAGGTSHRTPVATAPTAGSWVVSVWSDKQTVARTWSPPGGVTVRSNVAGVGAGGGAADMASLLADGNTAVPVETVGGLTATVPSASNRAAMFTIVLAPAG
jgi:PKD repeat protein